MADAATPPEAPGRPPALPERFRRAVLDVVGPGGLITDPERCAPHAIDWTGRFRGHTPAVVRPHDLAAVAGVVAAARADGVALTPQGGNTSLVGGATPCDGEVVLDLRHLSGVHDIDEQSGQLTAGAGTPVAVVQEAARAAGWAYGVDWSARDTATIGGSVATDAGGLRFVRHGGTRRQLLGVEAVLGRGDIVDHLPRVEKDNTGFDIAAVLCGSEGTLGVVTGVRLRLVPPSPPLATALVGFAEPGAAVVAAHALRRVVEGLEAVELMVAAGFDLVRESFLLPDPLGASVAGAYLLVEVGSWIDPGSLLADAVAGLDGVVDAAVAMDGPRRRQLWQYRELHTEAIGRLGAPHKLDVTLPADTLAGFVVEVPQLVTAIEPASRTWLFGHAADGNVHVNVTGLAADDDRIDAAVFGLVSELGGSISAEHGIGRAKRRWLHLAQAPGSIAAMWALKDAFDPDGILNPNVLLPAAP